MMNDSELQRQAHILARQIVGVDDETITKPVENAVFALFRTVALKAELKQTRKLYQHEKDVWGSSRNDSYLKAEIKQLKVQLAQQEGGRNE